ncbi:murein hydrolase activator EnvC family protein [Pusillimonas noertemannii]|uniref:Septal ring factor EnvC (AmiA/AmiB activator) n=1 Tax=Pusillimonas noertemannii TaxID=305977 RepID=A0A2U1CN78_9BURK|nr:peptidoglycan DD-metalloendopeptidase family protein [Pusillimonas noertemannii]NYT68510.1 peptidoglycan DD-metalloendopeptidase family protein [Pusillimonas noertemannii]PVY62473.1 septal ring factor EnvC (AmiA/AmiB activator) [Pusillimonas noertemannii]TFL11077.1 peptidase [Pusillimonas noertemannii]
MQRIGSAALLAVWLGSALAADPAASLQSRQADAQAQQARLRDRIETLQKDINKHEASRNDAAQALEASETAISDIDRRLAELARQKQQAEDDLKRLEGQIADSRQELKQRQQELADQLRAQYASGLSPWAALLSGDDPQAIGRELGYLSYVSQAQAAALQAVAQALERLNALQDRSRQRKSELERVAEETGQRKAELEEQKQERKRVLDKISEQLKAQRAQADTMQRDERRLGRLITGLEEAIAKQAEEARLAEERRREAARQAELRRQEEARRLQEQRAEQERQRQEEAQRQSHRDQEAARQAREQVERARAREREQEQAARQQAQEAPASAPEPAALRGLRQGLPYPVRGEVQGRFGAERPDGGLWRGIVLRASEGTPVKAIAAGRVVYADWLKGFGNILIIDHGAQYLSVYAYNQSLLKQVGQAVAAGEAIATVGATGGQVESGLYFEIRHQGKPVNPLLWLAR